MNQEKRESKMSIQEIYNFFRKWKVEQEGCSIINVEYSKNESLLMLSDEDDTDNKFSIPFEMVDDLSKIFTIASNLINEDNKMRSLLEK
jgi:uncharacterized protein YkuJ